MECMAKDGLLLDSSAGRDIMSYCLTDYAQWVS